MDELSDLNIANILKALFTAEVSLGASLYVALKVGGSEVSGNGYARQAITRSNTTFTVDQANRQATLAIQVSGWQAVGGAWGSVSAAALYTASTGGAELVSTSLQTARDVLDGETFDLAAGVWTISFPLAA